MVEVLNSPVDAQPIQSMITRAKSGITKPNPKYTLISLKQSYPKLKTVKTTLKDLGWIAAMGVEIGTLHEPETWDLVPPQPHISLLGNKWVFRTSYSLVVTLKN